MILFVVYIQFIIKQTIIEHTFDIVSTMNETLKKCCIIPKKGLRLTHKGSKVVESG